jgi:hypothetical protein
VDLDDKRQKPKGFDDDSHPTNRSRPLFVPPDVNQYVVDRPVISGPCRDATELQCLDETKMKFKISRCRETGCAEPRPRCHGMAFGLTVVRACRGELSVRRPDLTRSLDRCFTFVDIVRNETPDSSKMKYVLPPFSSICCI